MESEDTSPHGKWIGDHWVDRQGYCKACDGKCENKQTKNEPE